MALFLSKVQQNGVASTYHKIDDVTLNFRKAETACANGVIYSYLDQITREQTPLYPVEVTTFSVMIGYTEFAGADPRQVIYGKIKALPEWAGSTDM